MPSRPVRHRCTAIAVSAVLVALLGLLGLLIGPFADAGAEPAGTAEPAQPVRPPPWADPSEPALEQPPSLTLPADVDFVLGRAGDSYEIEAEGDPVPAVRVDRLPAGLHLTAHRDGSATIEGTPTGPAGASTVEVTAQNAIGRRIAQLTVTVNQAAAFSDQAPLRFVLGDFSSVLIRADGYPAPGIGLDGDLPAGLSFTDGGDGTATIAGTPLAVGETPVTLTAVNVVSDAAVTTTVSVVGDPHDPRPVPVRGLRFEP